MELKEQFEALTSKLEGKSKQEVKEAVDAFEIKMNESLKNEIKEVKDAAALDLKAVQEHVDNLDIKMQENKTKSVVETPEMEIEGKKEEFKSIAFKQGGKTVELKASTIRASVANNTNSTDVAGIGQLAHRQLTAYDVFPKIPVTSRDDNGIVKYSDWDQDTTVRAAASVAEGVAFPESTAKFAQYTLPLIKLGDSLPVSEEFQEDSAQFAAELDLFLTTNINIIVDNKIINGLGGTDIKGLKASTPVYTPVASGIADASIYDLVPKVSETITKTGGAKYIPNIVFMNKTDINKYKLKKDANNNYIMPPFVSKDGQVIDGVLVLENNSVVANTMFLGDSRFGRIYEKAGMTIATDTVGNQFLEDMISLKVRKRMLFLIRTVDQTGWKQVTDIDAALVTLAS